MPQTTVTTDLVRALPGMIAHADIESGIVSAIAEVAIPPGVLVLRGAAPSAGALPAPLTADPDGIIESVTTSDAAVTISGAGLSGATGAGRMSPARRITLTLSANAHFLATSWILRYFDELGVERAEAFAVPAGGDATLTSVGYASRAVSLFRPAQTGTGGAFTLGTSAEHVYTASDALGVAVHSHKALALAPSSTGNEVYEDGDTLPVMRRGVVWCEIENEHTAGDTCFARVTVEGAEKAGALRVADTDSGDSMPVRGARVVTSGVAGALAKVEINL